MTPPNRLTWPLTAIGISLADAQADELLDWGRMRAESDEDGVITGFLRTPSG